MKYLLTILLALAISLPLSAQDTTAKKSSFWTMGDDEDSYDYSKKKSKELKPITPGSALKKASNSFITSLVFGVVGSGVIIASTKSDAPNVMYAVGGICGVMSTVYYVNGVVLIGKAGVLMDNKNNSVAFEMQNSNTGITLALKF